MSTRRWNQVTARLLRPMGWSITARRLCLLLLPVAVPVWLVALSLAIVCACAAEIGRWLSHLWNAPPKPQRHRYGYGR